MTNGHLDLIERGAKMLTHVVVGVANNPTNKPLFNLEERVALAIDATAHISNVSVVGFSELLVDFAKAHNAAILLRGVRSVSDFEYEFQLANANRQLYSNLELCIFDPN